MNNYTENFIHNCFTNFSHDNINVTSEAVDNQVPCVEIFGLDLALLNQIYQQAVDLKHNFTFLSNSGMYNEWYHFPRAQGWKELQLKENNTVAVRSLLDNTEIKRPTKTVYKDKTLLDLCNDLLHKIPNTAIKIQMVEAGGWIQPHRDIKVERGLRHLWIPLHNFPPCLKVWPFGWLQHKLGSMYLFNNADHVHAVHNNTDLDRFILMVKIDPKKPPQIIQEALNNCNNYKKLFCDN